MNFHKRTKRVWYGGNLPDEQTDFEKAVAENDHGAGDFIYINANIINNTNKPIRATTNTNYAATILADGKSRNACVVRMVLDGSTIPIGFLPKTDSGLWIVLSYAGNDWPVEVVFESDPGDTLYSPRQPFYNIQQFLNAVNFAFQTAAEEFNANYAPFLVYNPQTSLISIMALEEAIDNNMFIYMNNTLYNYFGNFLSIHEATDSADHKDYRIDLKNFRDTNTHDTFPIIPPNHIGLVQEYCSVFRFFDVTTIQLESVGLGVKGEVVPEVNNTENLTTNSNGGGGVATTNILTDLQPYYSSGDPAGVRGQVYYAPQDYRFMTLEKNNIQTIDITVTLKLRDGSTVPYYVPARGSMQIKLGFFNKQYNNLV